jgi:hypothetical protein
VQIHKQRNGPDSLEYATALNDLGIVYLDLEAYDLAEPRFWVPDGMTFYLQDVTGGKPLTSDYTLATLVVNLQKK